MVGRREKKTKVPAPSAAVIEAIIDTAFWASLRREEGYSPKISLTFLPPWQAGQPLLFEQRLPLSPELLSKLSPGVEHPGLHLGGWMEGEDLYVWGTTLKISEFCFVLDVSEPGLLVVKHRQYQGLGKFTNLAVLTGDQVKMVNGSSASRPDCPELLSCLLGLNSTVEKPVRVLVQLAVSMRSHQHGGTLLIVPASSQTWQEPILHPMKYTVTPAFPGLADLIGQDPGDQEQDIWKASFRQEVDHFGGLTAIDGATIINDRYELKAFGTKIGRREGSAPIEQILLTEPVDGVAPARVHPAQNGGTRHLSAAQFVHDQRDSLACVASQDGRFTIFSWSAYENMVQAHRIDSLLL